MNIAKTVLVICCISIVSMASAQIDPSPDGIGIYFDEDATVVVTNATIAEPVTAYLIATNLSQVGTLALWEAHLHSPGAASIQGTALNAFNMASNMPGGEDYSFACAVYQPFPDLQPIMVLATLEITVWEEGSIGLHVNNYSGNWPLYRVDDMYNGQDNPLYQSSGSPDLPVAILNGETPVANETQSWDRVKSLYQ